MNNLPDFGCLVGLSLMVVMIVPTTSSAADTVRFYVGTYTGAKSKGIYQYQLNLGSGDLTSLGLAGEVPNPSFLAIHPSRRYLYAAGETGKFEGKPSGALSAFSINAEDGKLTLLNQQPSGGPGPCHIVVDRSGRCVLAANYSGGSVTAALIKPDGSLDKPSAFIQHTGTSVNKQRQEAPHAHSINVDLNNRFAMVADLGLDRVMVYQFDSSQGSLTPNDPPFAQVSPGSGPRHFAFHPNGRFAYVINEMLSTVTAFEYQSKVGVLKEVQTISSLPQPTPGNSTAEVQVHPNGRFLYGSNRGHNSIAVFSIDQSTGKLTALGHQSTRGKTPRNFGIEPGGRFLIAANQDSSTLSVFRIDKENGMLTPVGEPVEAPTPVCVKFVPSN